MLSCVCKLLFFSNYLSCALIGILFPLSFVEIEGHQINHLNFQVKEKKSSGVVLSF